MMLLVFVLGFGTSFCRIEEQVYCEAFGAQALRGVCDFAEKMRLR